MLDLFIAIPIGKKNSKKTPKRKKIKRYCVGLLLAKGLFQNFNRGGKMDNIIKTTRHLEKIAQKLAFIANGKMDYVYYGNAFEIPHDGWDIELKLKENL